MESISPFLQQVPLLSKPAEFSGAAVAFIRRTVLVLCGVLGQGWISGRDFWLLESFAVLGGRWAPSLAEGTDRNQSERQLSSIWRG